MSLAPLALPDSPLPSVPPQAGETVSDAELARLRSLLATIEEYGTEEINAAVSLRAQLATAEVDTRWRMAHDIVAKVESRRMRVLTDKNDPSFTEHFAEIENEIIAMVPDYYKSDGARRGTVAEAGEEG